MDHERDEPFERLLAASRPRPRLDFADELESGLFPPSARDGRVRRPLIAAAGLSGALAAVVLALGLAGSGPLSPDGGSPSEAKQNCRYVTVTQVRRVPRIVTDRTGKPDVITRAKRVQRHIKRCS